MEREVKKYPQSGKFIHTPYFIWYRLEGKVMSKPIEDGQLFEVNGVEYLYAEGEITEIACSYPDVETGLAALRKEIEQR